MLRFSKMFRSLQGLFLLPFLALAMIGCSFSKPSMAPKEEALATLKSALEAWQNGETIEDLKKSPKQITVSDQDWLAGKPLTKFEIDSEKDLHSGHDRKFLVKLWIDQSEGEPKEVKYTVLTSPVHLVTREVEGYR